MHSLLEFSCSLLLPSFAAAKWQLYIRAYWKIMQDLIYSLNLCWCHLERLSLTLPCYTHPTTKRRLATEWMRTNENCFTCKVIINILLSKEFTSAWAALVRRCFYGLGSARFMSQVFYIKAKNRSVSLQLNLLAIVVAVVDEPVLIPDTHLFALIFTLMNG